MSAPTRPTQFGRIHPPDEAWLAKAPAEPILEPELPNIDTHHHLWERNEHRYLLHEFLDATWKKGVPQLARCPNVVMKLGGMMMRLAAYDYRSQPAPPSSSELASLWGPYIGPCLELFGADRCLYESNFPVDKMGIG